MRFITEFELEYPYTLAAPELCIDRAKRQMGDMIESSFERKEKEVTIRGNEGRRWSLEIEAFPMDKWMEFRQRVVKECNMPCPHGGEILNMLKELESFGKLVPDNPPYKETDNTYYFDTQQNKVLRKDKDGNIEDITK